MLDGMTYRLQFAGFRPVEKSGRTISGPPMTGSTRRIVIDSISAPSMNAAIASYEESGAVPHFTLDFTTETVTQHIDLDKKAVGVSDAPVEPHLIGSTVWVNIIKPANMTPDSEESFWLGQAVGLIVDGADVNEYWEPFPTMASVLYRTSEMTLGDWRAFEGICAAAHVPLCSRYGPGEVDSDAFGEGLGSPAVPQVASVDVPVVESETEVLEPEVVDPDVLEKLAAELVKTAKPVDPDATVLGKFPGRKVQLGSGGKAVEKLREAYGLGKGKFDDELQDHVTFAQELAGLTPDGIVDAETWLALDRILVEGDDE